MKLTNNTAHDGNAAQSEEAGQSEHRMAAAYREELVRRIAHATFSDGETDPLKGLHLARVSSTRGPAYGVAFPTFCVIAQGTKEIYLGEESYRYDPYHSGLRREGRRQMDGSGRRSRPIRILKATPTCV